MMVTKEGNALCIQSGFSKNIIQLCRFCYMVRIEMGLM